MTAALDPEQAVLERIALLRAQDATFSQGRILGSMCSAPHPLAVEAHLMFLEANLGDPGHFPGAARIEAEYIDHLFSLAGGKPAGASGQVTGGASEANLLALMLMRQASGRRSVIVPATGHFSFEKAAKLLGMELKIADVDSAYRIRPDAVEALIDDDTAGIVAVAGTTQVGSVDPVERLAAISAHHALPLHVDAAFGGYILPFLPTDHPQAGPFGFDLKGVTSVSMDSHKMGMATMGAGALLVRHDEIMELLSVPTPYLSTPRQRGLLGTRSAAPVAAAWSLFGALGISGYQRVVRNALDLTAMMVEGLGEAGIDPLIDPPLNIIAVPSRDPQRLQSDLGAEGWRVNILPRLRAIRLVVNPHVTRAVLDQFLPSLVLHHANQGGERHAPTQITQSV